MTKQKIAAVPSIRRLPSYLHIIRQSKDEGNEYISGTVIAQELHLEPIQVRKDLAITGIVGKPKKGYPVIALMAAIEHFLGWDEMQQAILVGAGNLGTALTGYPEFQYHGLNICAAFDQDPAKIGKRIHGVPIFSLETLPEQIKNLQAKIAILTVPSAHAQGVYRYHGGSGNHGDMELYQRQAESARQCSCPEGRPYFGLRDALRHDERPQARE